MRLTSIIVFVLIMLATTFLSMLHADQQSATTCHCFRSSNGHGFPLVDSLKRDNLHLTIHFKPHSQPLSIWLDHEREVFSCVDLNQCEIKISNEQLNSAKSLQIVGLGHILETLKISN